MKRGPEMRPETQLVFSDHTTGTIHNLLDERVLVFALDQFNLPREAIQFCTCQDRSPTELSWLRGLGGPDTSLPCSSRKGGRNARSNQKPKQRYSTLP